MTIEEFVARLDADEEAEAKRTYYENHAKARAIAESGLYATPDEAAAWFMDNIGAIANANNTYALTRADQREVDALRGVYVAAEACAEADGLGPIDWGGEILRTGIAKAKMERDTEAGQDD